MASDISTRLSAERTHLSHERTLMSWVRTATSLITFGFTFYKFFALDAGRSLPGARLLLSPRAFGMIMIGTGLIALVLGAFEHRVATQRLRTEFGIAPRSVAFFVAGIISILGILAFAAALLRA